MIKNFNEFEKEIERVCDYRLTDSILQYVGDYEEQFGNYAIENVFKHYTTKIIEELFEEIRKEGLTRP